MELISIRGCLRRQSNKKRGEKSLENQSSGGELIPGVGEAGRADCSPLLAAEGPGGQRLRRLEGLAVLSAVEEVAGGAGGGGRCCSPYGFNLALVPW